MRILAEASASIEEKERAFSKWLDEHPDATLAGLPSHNMAQEENDLQVVLGLRGMIGPSTPPVAVSDLKLNATEDGFTMTMDGPPAPVYLIAALRSAGLLLPGERIKGIVRLPYSDEITVTVAPHLEADSRMIPLR